MGRGTIWICWLLLCLCALVPAAGAQGIDLRRDVCTATLPDDATDDAVAAAPYACGAGAPSASGAWLWLRLDAARVRSMPAGWHLLVDQTRFDRIAVLAGGPGGYRRMTRTPDQLARHWAPGGVLQFAMPSAGAQVETLFLGFHRIDDLSLMRKVVAVPADAQTPFDARWFILMGVFAGTMVSALAYNIVIHAGRRYAFQRWYLAWVACAFAYGLTWSNMSALLVPGLVGPVAVRLDFVLVGLMVATGNMFFFSVVERGKLPHGLVLAGRLLAVAGATLGIAAACDTWLPAVATDRWLNYVIAATAVTVALSCAIAVRGGSRVIWFYMIGWGPVISVFLARLARNLGMVPQNDLIDMATFAALAFEALVLSLAIADRFRTVRQELALARQRRTEDLIEANALRLAARTDFLTGLGNRAAFQETARELVGRGDPFSLFLLDVDFLKEANDRLGHASGDALLRHIGAALSDIAEPVAGAQVARIGGDEFAMLLPGGVELEPEIIARIAELQGTRWQRAGQVREVSVSVGSAAFPGDAATLDVLHQNADLALYHAKRLGRGRHYRYDPLQRILRDLQAEFTADAGAAIDRGEFRLDLQPIVTLQSGIVCGYEALLRWEHPDHGLMLPERFGDVLVAEKIGLRVQEHVLELALARLSEHRGTISMLSVNFTSAQLAGPHAAQHVLDRLAHHGLPPESLCIEVTEAVILDRGTDAILAALRTLHDAGVCVTLDDFGTGYASLGHLRRMPIDRIKMDRSFVVGIDYADGNALAMAQAIIGLARGLGTIVIAEGIETPEQGDHLRQLGCHLGQGYLYGRPASLPLPAPASSPVEAPVAPDAALAKAA